MELQLNLFNRIFNERLAYCQLIAQAILEFSRLHEEQDSFRWTYETEFTREEVAHRVFLIRDMLASSGIVSHTTIRKVPNGYRMTCILTDASPDFKAHFNIQ